MIPDWTLEDFTNLEPLAKGTYATVYRAVYCPTRQMVTLKCIDKSLVSQEAVEREIRVHRSLDHPLICEYFGMIDLPDTTILILEYVKGFSLLEAVDEIGIFSELDAQKIFCQILSAVKYLHTIKDFLHLDLTLENVLMTFQKNIRIADFGCAIPGASSVVLENTDPQYTAPEVFFGKPATKKTDIWTLGIILYALVVGEYPFDAPTPDDMKHKIVTGDFYIPEDMSPELANLLTLMFHRDFQRRISIDQIEKHPWLCKTRCVAITCFEVCMCQPLLVFPDQAHLDEEVLDAMEQYGIDTSQLTVDYMLQNDDRITMMYRIIKRSNSFVDIQRMYHSVMVTACTSSATSSGLPSVALPKIRTAEPLKKGIGLKFMQLPRAHKTPVPHTILSPKGSKESSDSPLVEPPPTVQLPPAPSSTLEMGVLEKVDQPRRRFMTLAKSPMSNVVRASALKLPGGRKKSLSQLPIVTPGVNVLRKSSFVLPTHV